MRLLGFRAWFLASGEHWFESYGHRLKGRPVSMTVGVSLPVEFSFLSGGTEEVGFNEGRGCPVEYLAVRRYM